MIAKEEAMRTTLRSPKRRAAVVFAGAMAIGLAINACQTAPVVTAEAEGETALPEPQEFYFQMVETERPDPSAIPTLAWAEPVAHQLDEEEVKILARLLWSSPLREERQKKALAWVAVNRIGVHPFGSTLKSVVTKNEFTFYDRKAHVSEENVRIATEVLNAYYSITKDHLNVKRPFPASGVKVQFLGDPARYIRVLDADMNLVWDGTER